MKKFRSFLAVLLVICMLPTISLTAIAADGAVTFTSLATADGANGVKIDGTTYTLTKDITVDATNEALTGVVIDGAGYTITTSVPLFEDISGTVKNLKLAGTVNDTSKTFIGVLTNKVSVGALSLANVINNADLITETVSDKASVGGFIGQSTQNVVFDKCINNGNITANSEKSNSDHRGYVGGFIGQADAATTFTSCINNGEVKGNTFTGGFIGYASKTNSGTVLTNCANIGDVSTKYTRNKNQWIEACLAGGFVGALKGAGFTISGCYNIGNISTESGQSALDAFASGFLCVSEVFNKEPIIRHSFSAGTETVSFPEGGKGYASSIMNEFHWNSAWDSYKIENCQINVYIKADGNAPFTFKTDATTSNIKELNDKNANNKYTAEELANGTLLNKLNVGSEQDYFVQRVGKDANPKIWIEFSDVSIADYWTKNDTTYSLDVNAVIIVGCTYVDNFAGTLEGNGATIYTYAPLFADISGTIQNLTIEGSVVDSNTVSGSNGVAALAKKATDTTTLKNITNNADVQSTAEKPNQVAVGGLIGLAVKNDLQLTLENCRNNGDISATGCTSGGDDGRVYVGGLVGCVAKVSGNPANGVTRLTNCVNSGNVLSNSISGGLIGRLAADWRNTIEITQCVNLGNVTTKNDGAMAQTWNYCAAAGFVGSVANNTVKITDSVNLGDVSATAEGTNTSVIKATASGLCNLYGVDGRNQASSTISGNYSLGNVTATAPEGEAAYAGLLVSDLWKRGTWTAETAGEFVRKNYVLAIDDTKNGQDIFNTLNGQDETEAGIIAQATKYVKTVNSALAFEMTQEASIRLYSKDETGIRFNSSVNKDAITSLENAFGKTYGESYEIGTLLWVTSSATLDEYTHASMDAAGATYVVAKRTSAFNENELQQNKYIIRGSLVDISAKYSSVYVSARAYIKIGDLYFYADGVSTTCVKDVANIAYNDETANYSTEIMGWLENYGATSNG